MIIIIIIVLVFIEKKYKTRKTVFHGISTHLDVRQKYFLNFIYLFIHGKKIHQVHKCLKNPKT